MKKEDYEKTGLSAETLKYLSNIYEKLSGFRQVECNWSKLAQQITSFQNTGINFNVLQERLNSGLLLVSMSEELREYTRIVNETVGISEEEFETRYSAELERSRELGRNGWIPSEHGNPRDFAKWYQWVKESPEKIIEFFEEDDERVIKSIKEKLSDIYVEAPYSLYYQNGIAAFERQDYMTTALYLTILFEVRISNLVDFPKRNADNKRLTYVDKYSEYGFSIQKKKDYVNSKSFLEKRYNFLNVYPALEEYTARLFCFGKLPLDMNEQARPEPDYLDRTWLLHGRCCRETTKMDCVQLLNALDVCEFVFNKINQEVGDSAEQE
uniref:hypothetical protein n=1 Tax=Enterocloster clostridioformis TaxID=1531 RepID=UPI00204A2C41|nr:MAG TPA: hypothetical protein [Caudoviricetes sp.]